MLQRKVYRVLEEWRLRKNHHPLLVKGQRQVGKTFIIRKYAETNYKSVAYVDFNRQASAKSIFAGDIDVDTVVKLLEQYTNVEIIPGETLIFLDEIQECKRARAALKFLDIDGRFDVIASGSMLGIEIPSDDDKEEYLVPSGSEEHITMYPLDFEEFLWSRGVLQKTIDDVKKSIRDKRCIPKSTLAKFESYFTDYLVVGGMPEPVQKFAETGKYYDSVCTLGNLVESCRNDIVKYCKGVNKVRTLECYDSIPFQLAKSNKKFMYSAMKGGGSRQAASKYSDNLLWIKGAGYGNFSYAISGISLPLESFRKDDSFRIYLSDTGMLISMYGDETRNAIVSGDSSFNFGAVMENAVACGIMHSGRRPYYYLKNSGKNRMEIDFVESIGGKLVAIEVKSGNSRGARSLLKAKEVFGVEKRIKFEKGNVSVDDEAEHYPLFASGFFSEIS